MTIDVFQDGELTTMTSALILEDDNYCHLYSSHLLDSRLDLVEVETQRVDLHTFFAVPCM